MTYWVLGALASFQEDAGVKSLGGSSVFLDMQERSNNVELLIIFIEFNGEPSPLGGDTGLG